VKTAKATPWQRAAAFAARAHAGQTRSDGETPYFSHCARVALIVSDLFDCRDDEALAAAFLHDTIEDTKTDFDELEEHFGHAVAELVAALTKNAALPEARRERDYDVRLSRADWRARLIKLADALDNWTDATTPKQKSKAITRSRRALALAKSDANSHPETARAITVLVRAMQSGKVVA
jgi:(p)ppGpp synthase/HD superfamily hydrolase